MKKEEFKTHWPVLKPEVQKKWPKLTEAEIENIDGNLTLLVTTLQSNYFFVQEQAEQEIKNLYDSLIT